MSATLRSSALKSRFLLLVVPIIALLGAAGPAAAATPGLTLNLSTSVNSTPTQSVPAGTTATVTVTAKANGSTASHFIDNIKLTTSQSKDKVTTATLPASSGVATFTVTFNGTAGTDTLTATDATHSSDNGTVGTEALTITPGAATKLGVVVTSSSSTTPQTTASADATMNVAVTAYDVGGNIATGYTGTVTLNSASKDAWQHPVNTNRGTFAQPSTNSSGTYSAGSYTFTSSASDSNANNGVATFSVQLETASSSGDTITVTDSSTATIKGNVKVTVTPGVAHALTVAITSTPTKTTENSCGSAACWFSGQSVSMKVTAVDAEGNTAPSYLGNIKLSNTLTSGTTAKDVPTYPGGTTSAPAASYTFVPNDKGTKTFPVTLEGCGINTVLAPCTDTIKAADQAANSTITGSATAINVVTGPIAHLGIAPATTPSTSSPITANGATTFNVTATNNYGAPITNFGDTLHFSTSDAMATLPADAAYSNNSSNVDPVSLTFHTSGPQTVTVADQTTNLAGKPTLTATYSASVSPVASAAALNVSTDDVAVNGQTINVTVSAVDVAGYPVSSNSATSGYGKAVTLSDVLMQGGTTIPNRSDTGTGSSSAHTFAPAKDKGSYTFPVTVKGCTSGTCTDTITATDNSSSPLTNAVAVTVTAGRVTQLAVTAGGSTSTKAGASTRNVAVPTVTVTAENAYSQQVKSYTGKVHFTSSDKWATLPADYHFTGTASSGGDSGSQTFNDSTNGQVTLNTKGSQTLNVTDITNPTLTGSAKITVN